MEGREGGWEMGGVSVDKEENRKESSFHVDLSCRRGGSLEFQ